MGEIFLAEKRGALGVGKKVVIKRILPDLAQDRQFTRGFEDEARVAMQLNHSNIVQVFDFGQEDGQLYLVSEYVEGADLAQVLTLLKNQDRHLPLNLALGILIRVAAALDYAHKKTGDNGEPLRIVHRDVNPSNVLISFSGDVKITDFGIAKFEARKSRTLPNQIKGKVMYLAPEMITGHDIDMRADIFSFGSMAYEMLCQEHPFSGGNEGEVIDRIKHVRYTPLNERRRDLPMALVKIVEKCLQRDPGMRYQDMAAVQQELTNYLFASHTVLTDSDIGHFLARIMGKDVEQSDVVEGTVRHRTLTVRKKRRVLDYKGWLMTGVAGVLLLVAMVVLLRRRPVEVKPKPAVHPFILRQPALSAQTFGRRSIVLVVPSELQKPTNTNKNVHPRVGKAPKKRINVTIRQPVRPAAKVVFRFFPARANVLIDGKDIDTKGNNIVTWEVGPGRHHIVVLDTVGGGSRRVNFDAKAGQQVNLGTIAVTGVK